MTRAASRSCKAGTPPSSVSCRRLFFLLLASCYLGDLVSSSTSHVFTNSFLVRVRDPALVDEVARRNGFENWGSIHSAVQQVGFRRFKRGYKSLTAVDVAVAEAAKTHKDPTDPYFTYQWYLEWITCTRIFVTTTHGTRCAGEVSAARDNDVCGVGVAYDSKVAGIRMLDQPYMTDLIEANSMGHEPHLIDIYSASWGPTDDGKTVDGPRNATMRAIVRGVNEGRRGLGNIYVWASGDGGSDDDCNCDGYAASMWTISINSAINDGQNAHYDESCSSTLASTFSNGAKDPNTGVATTDLYGKCTKTHSGTSAAAPEAAGVFALALEANPSLTWRDIQHLTVLTSKRNSLFDAKRRFQWTMNGVGLEFNHLFGFGVLDAGSIVTLAKAWRSVPARFHCQGGLVTQPRPIPTNGSIILTLDTRSCQGSETEVNYLEHVQAVISLNSSRRGDVEMFLTSPMGTRSMILSRRPNDDDGRDGFTKWPFMTTHTWGEDPRGRWTLEVGMERHPLGETWFLKKSFP
uniref:Neuroendocrine convertase 2 n=1 Tax=Alona affinis TaxID=381656 RepID=A0A9N6ZEN5_9CRUS|nr:EOG090X02T5 [Alona affinis]